MTMSSAYQSSINRMVSLKVDNVSENTTKNDLKTIFERVGPVGDIFIPRKKFTQERRGFAFVRYYNERDANDAVLYLNGSWLNGHILTVQRARIPRYTRRLRRSRSSENRSSRSPQRRSLSRNRSPVRRSYTRSRSPQRHSYSTSRSPQRHSYDRFRSPQRRFDSRFRSSGRFSYSTSRSYSRSGSNTSKGGYAASRSKS